MGNRRNQHGRSAGAPICLTDGLSPAPVTAAGGESSQAVLLENAIDGQVGHAIEVDFDPP